PMPYFVKALSSIRNPLELLLMSDKQYEQVLKDFEEAERRIAGRSDFDDIRQELIEVKRMIETAPRGGGGGLLNALPQLLLGGGFEDDDELDEEPSLFGPPVGRSRSKRKKRSK